MSKSNLTIGDIEVLNFNYKLLGGLSISDLISMQRFALDSRISHNEIGLVEEADFFDKVEGICYRQIHERLHNIFDGSL